MAQVYAAKKTGSFLKNNWTKILAFAVILYVGYKVSQGIRGLGEFFKAPTLPTINLPEFKFPEFKFEFPSLPLPSQPPAMMPPIVMTGGTPAPGSTGIVDIPRGLIDQLNQMLKERPPETVRMGQSFADYQKQMERDRLEAQKGLYPYILPDGRRVYVTPSTAAELDRRYMVPRATVAQYDMPIGPPNMQQLLQMGLAIDMPTKMGQPTLVNQVIQQIQAVERAQGASGVSTVITLSGLSRLYPHLSASALADLRARLTNDFPRGFDFGTNTGSGLVAAMDTYGKNPITPLVEQQRAQQTFTQMYGSSTNFANPNFV